MVYFTTLKFVLKNWSVMLLINGGYYMAARGYEFYLRVLKVSLTSERSERVRDTFSTRTTCFIHFRNDEKLFTNH